MNLDKLKEFFNNLAIGKRKQYEIVKAFVIGNMPGRVVYDGNRFYVKIRKESFIPVLKRVGKLSKLIKIPRLNNMTILTI
ncbi:MAG TPA: hypothetical protein ENI76_00085 [Ignavibacteria bacterium]|nr:hypothetical protein [Ignavibacteria bacterium]